MPTAPSQSTISLPHLRLPDESSQDFTHSQPNDSMATMPAMPDARSSMGDSSHTLVAQDMSVMGMKSEEAPWFAENYFTTQHPGTRMLRKTYIKLLSILSALVLVYMMGVLSIYWGALYSSPQQAHKLDAWIVVRRSLTRAWIGV